MRKFLMEKRLAQANVVRDFTRVCTTKYFREVSLPMLILEFSYFPTVSPYSIRRLQFRFNTFQRALVNHRYISISLSANLTIIQDFNASINLDKVLHESFVQRSGSYQPCGAVTLPTLKDNKVFCLTHFLSF